MEVVGLVASITTLLDATVKTIKYLGKVRSLAFENDPIDQLREALEQLADKLKPKKGLKNVARAFVWTFDNAYCEGILEKIERVKTRVSLALQSDTFALAQAIKKNTADISVIDERVSTIARDTRNLQINEEVKQRQEILEWLSPLNFFKTQQDVFARREEGTGQWLLDEPAFQNWLSGVDRILCCPGIPGAGKTTLASVVINFLRTPRMKRDSVGVAAMYCNFKERDLQSPENLFAGACTQLVQHRLPKALIVLHDTHKAQRTKPMWKDITRLFEDCVMSYDTVYMVVDAVDECSENVRNVLLKHFKALPSNVRLFITTRHIDGIIQEFRAGPMIEIRAKLSDLETYISSRIDSEARLAGYVADRASLRQEICDKVALKAAGMFLAAKFHIDSLSMKTTIKMLKKALANLSNDLHVLYDEALERIESQPQEDRKLAKNAVRWIAYSFRPLSASALQEALAIEAEETDFDVETIPSINLVLDVCAGLLIHDEENEAIRLVHYTAQDYFDELQHSRFNEVHPKIAMDCITYLSYECFQSADRRYRSVDDFTRDGIAESSNKTWSDPLEFSLLGYATIFWAQHAMVNQNVHLRTGIHIFLASNPKIGLLAPSLNAFESFSRTYGTRTRQGYEIAVFFGFIDELRGFIEDTETDTFINKDQLLHFAVEGNQSTAIEVLLDHGADIEWENGGYTPLLRAIAKKALEAATTLVRKGADVMGVSTAYSYMKPIASDQGNSAAPYLKLLLEAGATVRTEDIFESTGLMRALMRVNDIDTTEELFKQHAFDQEMEKPVYSEALIAASERGSANFVTVLLNYGADPNSLDWNKRTPLMRALEACHEECSLALLHQGADVNIQDEDGLSALHRASANGSLAMMEQLVKHHAAVDARSEPMCTGRYLKPVKSAWDHDFFSDLPKLNVTLRYQSHYVIDIDIDENTRISMWRPRDLSALQSLWSEWKKSSEFRMWKDGMTALDIAILRENDEVINFLKSLTPSAAASDSMSIEDYLIDRSGTSSLDEAEKWMDEEISKERQAWFDGKNELEEESSLSATSSEAANEVLEAQA